jgi:magnesium-transporting ATPase (P-type)
MNEQAALGLRTLMFGLKYLPDDTTKESLNDMPEEEMENSVELLGITGLEDLLQDNVAECIKQFRAAKIKVWMLTGDKGETAENIGQSCGLIDPDKHEVFKISG